MDNQDSSIFNGSSKDHGFQIYVWSDMDGASDDQTLSIPYYFVTIMVEETYQSALRHPWAAPRREGDGDMTMSVEQALPIKLHLPCHVLTSDDGTESSSSWAAVSGMMADLEFQLSWSLENLQWKKSLEDHRSKATTWTPLKNRGDLISRLLDVLRCMVKSDSHANRKVFPVRVNIEKVVVLPHHEFEALVENSKKEQADRRAETLVNLMAEGQASSLRRPSEREWLNFIRKKFENYEMTVAETKLNELARHAWLYTTQLLKLRQRPARQSAIKALEYFRISGRDFETMQPCAICREKKFPGAWATRMPCSHVFDSDCLMSWLQKNHVCPVCRYKLPARIGFF